MKMTSNKMKQILKERLAEYDYHTSFNRDKDTLRVEWKDTKQGVTITLPDVVGKYKEKGEQAVDELMEYITESLRIMKNDYELTGMEKSIYPVIRSTSFPTETNAGTRLVTKEHTAETRIFYALDLGKSYRLIDQALLDEEGWSSGHLDEIAMFNVRSLSTEVKRDTVADNDFYFMATQDGYDASRILNDAFLEELKANSTGELAIAVPHQDVLIAADVKNKSGYDILAQMTMKFFAEGRIPITSLSFIYDEKKLEPIFILAKQRPEK